MPRYLVVTLLFLAACSYSPPTMLAPTPTFDPVNADPTQVAQLDSARCYFFGYGIGAPFVSYTSPDLADQSTTGINVDVAPYEIVAQSEDRYQIDSGERVLVWINKHWGTSQGHCSDLPFEPTRPEPPDGICTLRYNVADEFPLYATPGGEMIGLMPWGEYLEITARFEGTTSGYKLRLSDGTEGYVDIPQQLVFYNATISGPCEDLPVDIDNSIGG
jgi:hypothetical protein